MVIETAAYIVMGVTVLAAAGLAVARLKGVKAQWFQATAHLFVGAWIAAAVLQHHWEFYTAVAVALSAVEVFAFLRDRF